jgi:hypothetical protein
MTLDCWLAMFGINTQTPPGEAFPKVPPTRHIHISDFFEMKNNRLVIRKDKELELTVTFPYLYGEKGNATAGGIGLHQTSFHGIF